MPVRRYRPDVYSNHAKQHPGEWLLVVWNVSVVSDSVERMFAVAVDVEGIPPGLDRMEPGPVLAGFLSAIDVAALSGHDRIVVLRAHQRMASHYAAHVYADMASVADYMALIDGDDSQWANESAAAEIRAALRLTRHAADTELGFALDLRRRLPRLWDRLASGEIDVRRAKTVTYGTVHLPEATAREVVDLVIDRAPQLTTGQLAALIRKLCIEADPVEAERRYDQATAERRIVTEATESGTAKSRTIDQLRADVYLDLLLGTNTQAGTVKGVVDLHADLETLARLSDTPGELAGYGPVIADIARQVAEEQQDAELRYTITDPDGGQPIYTGTVRRPTASQRRRVESRDRTCVFPGCRMPATDCDLDHRIPLTDSKMTRVDQLAPLCRHDHTTRHQAGWTYRPLRNGDYLWTTRLGHTYTTSGRPP